MASRRIITMLFVTLSIDFSIRYMRYPAVLNKLISEFAFNFGDVLPLHHTVTYEPQMVVEGQLSLTKHRLARWILPVV